MAIRHYIIYSIRYNIDNRHHLNLIMNEPDSIYHAVASPNPTIVNAVNSVYSKYEKQSAVGVMRNANRIYPIIDKVWVHYILYDDACWATLYRIELTRLSPTNPHNIHINMIYNFCDAFFYFYSDTGLVGGSKNIIIASACSFMLTYLAIGSIIKLLVTSYG